MAISPAYAQDDTSSSDSSGWALGAGVAVVERAYASKNSRVVALPLVGFEGERWFLRGTRGGIHLLRSEAFTLDALAAIRFDGIDVDDLDRGKLNGNGVDRDLLDDRDDAIDAGLSARLRQRWGVVRATATGDVSGTNDGYTVRLDYGFPLRVGTGVVTPRVGVTRWSGKLVDYYYGTSNREIERGVPAYDPGHATFASVGADLIYRLGQDWSVVGHLEYAQVPDDVQDSPLVDRNQDGAFDIMLGFNRRF